MKKLVLGLLYSSLVVTTAHASLQNLLTAGGVVLMGAGAQHLGELSKAYIGEPYHTGAQVIGGAVIAEALYKPMVSKNAFTECLPVPALSENPVVPNVLATLAVAYFGGRAVETVIGLPKDARFEFYGNLCAAVGLVLTAAKVVNMVSGKPTA